MGIGTVACAAGPRAAERGVAGRGTDTGLTPLRGGPSGGRTPLSICFVAVLDIVTEDGPGTGGTGGSGGGRELWTVWLFENCEEAEVG